MKVAINENESEFEKLKRESLEWLESKCKWSPPFIKLAVENAQERTKELYEKEFVRWCIVNVAITHPYNRYAEIENQIEFDTLDELHDFWLKEVKK